MYVFSGLHCLLPKAATRVEVFCKKGILKNFINFIGKDLCWSLFLIKLQGWHLFWRTSANNCFCTALTPITLTYLFYFIFNTFFLIITATTVNIYQCLLLVQIQKASKNLNLVSHFHRSHFITVIFFSMFFLSLSVLFHLFCCCCS